MTNEERKTALLDMWHNIATDKSLQVSLRLKASEHEARALGLIGNDPGVTIMNEPSQTELALQKLTTAQLEAIAAASDDTLKKTTAQKPRKAPAKKKNDTTTARKTNAPQKGSKGANTQKAQKEVKK